MHLRVLLPAEGAPRSAAKSPECFRCCATYHDRPLYKCIEPMREEWVACLACATSGVRPQPWPKKILRD